MNEKFVPGQSASRQRLGPAPQGPRAKAMGQPFRPIRQRDWFKTIAAGLAICAVVGTIADLLQPLAPVATYTVLVSLGLFASAAWAYRRYEMLRPDLGPVLAALAIVVLVAAGLKVAQAISPGGAERGVLASQSETLRDVQGSLLGIEKTLLQLGEGMRRVEGGVEAVARTTEGIDVRTKEIAGDVRATKRGIEIAARVLEEDRDPEAQARREKEEARLKLQEAGVELSNAGFMRAVAGGDFAAQTYLEILGIHGDEAALREALIRNRTDTAEFGNLKLFLLQVNSDHYATRVKMELNTVLKTVRKTSSVDGVRTAACAKNPSSFVEKFFNAGIGEQCRDDGKWLKSVVEFLKHVQGAVQLPIQHNIDERMWWFSLERHVKYSPRASKTVTVSELFAAYGSPATEDGKVLRVDGKITLYPQGAVGLFTESQDGVATFDFDTTAYNKARCYAKYMASDACSASLVFFLNGRNPTRLMAIAAIK